MAAPTAFARSVVMLNGFSGLVEKNADSPIASSTTTNFFSRAHSIFAAMDLLGSALSGLKIEMLCAAAGKDSMKRLNVIKIT